MNTLVSSGCSSIKSYIVINIDIDQYQNNNRDNIFCNIAQPYDEDSGTKHVGQGPIRARLISIR